MKKPLRRGKERKYVGKPDEKKGSIFSSVSDWEAFDVRTPLATVVSIWRNLAAQTKCVSVCKQDRIDGGKQERKPRIGALHGPSACEPRGCSIGNLLTAGSNIKKHTHDGEGKNTTSDRLVAFVVFPISFIKIYMLTSHCQLFKVFQGRLGCACSSISHS